MKKFVFLSLAFLLIACAVNLKSERLLSVNNLLRMNSNQINGIKSISIEDNSGFKYLKNDVKTSVFKTVSISTTTQSIGAEDEEKIRKVILDYQ